MSTRWFAAAALLLACTPGRAEPDPDGGVVLVAAAVQQCIEVDALLRKTCADLDAVLPAEHRRWCVLPAQPFVARTASAYAAFREQHRAAFARNADTIAKVNRETHEAFEHEFASVIAGDVPMHDLESLHAIMGDMCRTVETEWLAPR